MNYYLYVSDAKVKMLYDQIAPRKSEKKLIFRGGIGTWLGIERHVKTSSDLDGNLLAKLNVVCSWIRENEDIGNISSTECFWIEDSFKCYCSAPVPSETGAPVVLFQYQSPASRNPLVAYNHVLLVGSAAYLMPRTTFHASETKPLAPGEHWSMLSVVLNRILEGPSYNSPVHYNNDSTKGLLQDIPAQASEEDIFRQEIQWACGSASGPWNKYRGGGPLISVRSMYRVLHRHLRPNRFRQRGDGGPELASITLGTPIYVEWDDAQKR